MTLDFTSSKISAHPWLLTALLLSLTHILAIELHIR